jgi:hypothetical protein
MKPFVVVRSLALALLCGNCSASTAGSDTLRKVQQPSGRLGYVAGAADVRLFYRVDGSGPDTIVMLHGGPGFNLEGIRPDLTTLARHHALLYFDQRGVGRSEMPDTLRLTAAAMIEDLEALRRVFRLDQLLRPSKALQPGCICNHSGGRGTTAILDLILADDRMPD